MITISPGVGCCRSAIAALPLDVDRSETPRGTNSGDIRPWETLESGARVARMRVGVLASGSGTILKAMLERGLPVVVVVADRPCGALDVARTRAFASRARRAAPISARASTASPTRTTSSTRSQRHDVELVAIAGFGTILSKPFIDAYGGRAVNTHPALLPAFKGWHAVRAALEAGVKVTGTTVHLVTEDVDAGPILAQEAVPVLDGDTEDDVARTHQGSRAALVPRGHREARERTSNEDEDQAGAAVGLRQDRARRPRAGSARPRHRARLVGQHLGRARRRPAFR